MLHRILVANWKSNKTEKEAIEWLTIFSNEMKHSIIPSNLDIVLCPPFPLLSMLRDYIQKEQLPLYLGAQEISPFGKGAYTGEVSAETLKGLVQFVLVGHSERRKYFEEKDEELAFESLQAHEGGLSVIYCVEGAENSVSAIADYIAYEPTVAIGSGKGEQPSEANTVCTVLSKKHNGKPVCYGGSVDEKNCAAYLSQPSIHGLLVGGASLDAKRFCQMIQAISSLT